MQTNNEQIPPNEAANGSANSTQETGGSLRVRLGVQPRTFQKVWKRTFGYAFESGRIVSPFELYEMETKYLKPIEEKPEPKPRAKREPKQVETPGNNAGHSSIETANRVTEMYNGIVAAIKSRVTMQAFAAWAMFLIPTIGSIRNTVSVSGAFSGDYTTSLLITATISITGILWIVSRSKVSWWDLCGILIFQIFEALCNTAQSFKSLMGSMAYGLTTVSGKPSDLLDMVATLANKDHRDTAVLLAFGVSSFILAAQIKGLILIKGIKK